MKFLLDYLLPESCTLCGQTSQSGFCTNCQQLLPWKVCYCAICSAELAEPGICGRCQTRPPYFHQSAIPFHYRSPVSDHIQGLKYHEQFHYAVALSKMLSRWIVKTTAALPDVIVPIPLHRKRINQRGFNQAVEISALLSRQLNIPLNRRLLRREINTISQTGLNEKMRRINIKRAFSINRPCGYGHVALVDDVVTSGHTVNEAAKTLRMAGVDSISVWAIAKT